MKYASRLSKLAGGDGTAGTKKTAAASVPAAPAPAPAAPVPVAPAPAAPAPSVPVCDYKNGELPSCAPLAAGYVANQQKNPPRYGNDDALTRGTLFPGLDLPFMNIANRNNPYAGTPLGELMAIDFVIHELSLYLDTHHSDTEAFTVMKNLLTLKQTGRERYVSQNGPVSTDDLAFASNYSWTRAPWPWEYSERTGG